MDLSPISRTIGFSFKPGFVSLEDSEIRESTVIQNMMAFVFDRESSETLIKTRRVAQTTYTNVFELL